MLKWFFIAVLLMPVAEIATFVAVAWAIGFGWALALMVATTIGGFVVLRLAGRGQFARFRVAASEVDVAAFETNAAGFLTVLAGILLFLPGFLTDIAGALLLIGPVRRAGAAAFRRAVVGAGTGGPAVVDLAPEEWRQMPDRDTPRDPERIGPG